MFQIAATIPPKWIDLAPGIRGLFRYGPSEAIVSARRHARMVMEGDDRSDPEFAFITGCAIWGLVEWEGVGHPAPVPSADVAHGSPEALAAWIEANPPAEGVADLTADNIVALLKQRPDIYDKLDRTYVQSIVDAAAEKKGSGRSPTGTSTEVPPSATPAGTAPSAPIAKTTRAPKRGKRSGQSSKAAPAN
ncbi:hypothetical protein [Brevundimonas nasdae]|uniref:Uncharacterized protein n=1 Tax=Brevundimonas nasdae TaxID=172043 RepID=A0ABX8TIH2_9CAUL|nr:hypothetical protein [Brevundimonas nasdae]QYC10563.1 hypothetical protein KWG56_00625 [Brevundimonas nasdae]QYC13350.1 hypothetical protein KWG63_14180 [Brevundimonas nasdae]